MTEHDLHKAVVQLLKFTARPGLIWFHVPNGELRDTRTGNRLKAMGVRPGVADFCLTLPGGRAAFLELKSAKGRSSPEQKAFAASCDEAGALYAVAKSLSEATEILRQWGAIKTAAVAA
ncbi:MAG: VRR-NUC domain-containing protein [Bosea sp.]|nr:VRR-NUC domain-containing protein [Bosea sp. (in: a-proteobacteria)]